MADLACVMHVHTRHSDGGGSVGDVASAAAAAGADAVLITDHDTLAARAEEGWHGDVLVLVGVELSPKRRDHYLAFDLVSAPPHQGLSAAEICTAVTRGGGFGFAAHPFSAGSAMPVVRRFAQPQRWADLETPGLTGIEVWNVETEGAERARNPVALMRFARDPLAAMPEPHPAALRAWDRLGARRRVVGVAGLDAHEKSVRLGGWSHSPLPYARLFDHVRTHVQTAATPAGVLDYDRALIFDALRAGHCYMAVDAIAPAAGFTFEATGDGGVVPMGGEAAAEPYALLAELPTAAELALLCDGRVIATAEADGLALEVDKPGVYRLEARVGSAVWILSNPIYLR